jgi:PhnB protein
MASQLNPYLNFDETTRQALEFYHGVFGGDLALTTFGEFGAADSADADRLCTACS